MPDRYHIHTHPTPGRFRPVGKLGNVDWREDCSRCGSCVKLRCCYDVYTREAAYNRDPMTPVETLNGCKACLSCVQGCTKGLLSVSVNPEFLDLGDSYWKPDILLTTWNQSDTGKIPVSGAGYRGRFHGPGFDSIWTDMSEIVRPTRDGIHGREYISTSVDIGTRPMRLNFTPDGRMRTPPARLVEIQLPAVLDLPDWRVAGLGLSLARAAAARELHTLAVMPASDAARVPADLLGFVVPVFDRDAIAGGASLLEAVAMVEIEDATHATALAKEAAAINPGLVVSVRLALTPASAGRVIELARSGIRVFHLSADLHGRERLESGRPGRHIKDALREVHGRLVTEGIRDEVTLIVSGGIALAEHMAKAIICGADLVGVGTALLVALGCRVCREAQSGASCDHCPAELRSPDTAYTAQRMVNLMGAWHSQLIEVLGAMGIREVRRLRGEVGRAMFLEDIEREAFGDLARRPRAEVRA